MMMLLMMKSFHFPIYSCWPNHIFYVILFDHKICSIKGRHQQPWGWCWWCREEELLFGYIFVLNTLTRTVLVKITKTIVTKSILSSVSLRPSHRTAICSIGFRNSPVHFKWQQFCKISILEFRLEHSRVDECIQQMQIVCNGKW